MKKIIDFCLDKNIVKINLEVNSSNTVAINLYNKWGFKQVGCRKNYYNNGDGLLFTRFRLSNSCSFEAGSFKYNVHKRTGPQRTF